VANPRTSAVLGLASRALLVALFIATGAPRACAELQAASAEIKQATGRVEIRRKSQPHWVPAAVGHQLMDGDQIRALAASSAELALADRSTIVVAENTRFAVIKLAYDTESGARETAFHLVVGKVRAEITRAALQLVRTRQSNFTISTPGGVAAVRGTIIVVTYNPSASGAPGQAP
jgi:hypothetical protein